MVDLTRRVQVRMVPGLGTYGAKIVCHHTDIIQGLLHLRHIGMRKNGVEAKQRCLH